MIHNSLENYFKTVFSMKQHHHWGVSEIEDLIPFERDVYIAILKDYLEQKEEELRNQQLKSNMR